MRRMQSMQIVPKTKTTELIYRFEYDGGNGLGLRNCFSYVSHRFGRMVISPIGSESKSFDGDSERTASDFRSDRLPLIFRISLWSDGGGIYDSKLE